MAEIYTFDEFSGPNEKAVALQLASELPDDWSLICNKQLIQGEHSRETDFICVGSRTVFVIEEKGWSGQIRGTENGWLVHGELRSSPINQVEISAKVLAGILKNRSPQLNLYGSDLVLGVVVLSSSTAQLVSTDPRSKTRVFSLKELVNKLTEIDRTRDLPPFAARKREIVGSLTRLPTRPKVPSQIGPYNIVEVLDDQLGCRVFRAQHPDGQNRILKVFYGKDAFTEAPTTDSSVRRQYDSQRKLGMRDLCPAVDPFFTWEDGRALVIPFAPPQGLSFAKLAISGPATEQILPVMIAAFESLAAVHEQGVVHRSLRPDRVWWDSTIGQVRFSDFVIARIDGMETVVDRASEFDIDHPYRSAECRIDLATASPKSDVYSLAAIMLNWITGQSPPLDDIWQPEPLADTRKDLGDELAQIVQGTLWPALSIEPADRPCAIDVASRMKAWQAKQAEAEKAVGEKTPNAEHLPSTHDDRYEILETLGKGGTAETFLARDSVRDQLVVLKRLMRPDIHGYLATAEFKALNRLRHPCLPSLIEVYAADDPYHLKFEYREGKSLKDTWRELRSATTEAKHNVVRRIANDVLDALSYLHENQLLHRDVTPGNILLPEDESSRVLLIDLGLASPVSDAVSRVGTPLYLAPEVEQPAPRWSVSCDIYGLGVLLFELIADRLPYRTEGSKRLKSETIQPTGLDHPLSVSLCALLIEKACSPRPEDRFKSAKEMRTAVLHAFSSYQRTLDSETATSQVRAESQQRVEDVVRKVAVEPSKQINPFVAQLRQAFRNSSLGNANNRGMDSDFSRNTYVRTELDDRLLPEVLAGKWTCVALSGNPGDGKTAFLEEVRRSLLADKADEIQCDPAGWRIKLHDREFVAVYDASESHEGRSSDDLLKSAIAPLKGRSKPNVPYTVLLAINDGRLQDLVMSYRLSFRWLCESLRKQMASAAPDEDVLLIDLKHRAPIAADPRNRSLFLGLLDAFVAEESWSVCGRCSAFHTCTIRANATALRESRPREQLLQLITGVYFLAERRPTIRDLRSSLSWIITGDRDCASVHQMEDGEPTVRDRYYNLAFDPRAGEDLVLNAFQGLDPDRVPSPQLERYLIRPNSGALFDNQLVNHPSVELSHHTLRDSKHRYYFEFLLEGQSKPSPDSLLPARTLKTFFALVAGRTELNEVKQRILIGLQRLDRIPAHANQVNGQVLDVLALRLDTSEESLMVIRQWPSQEFEIVLPCSPDRYLNYLPDHMILRHVNGWPELQIGLPMFELLMRAADGTTPDAVEHQSLLMDFQRFRAQLLTSATKRVVLMAPGGDRSLVVCDQGVIKRVQENYLERI